MVVSLRDRNICSTPIDNRFLGVVLQAFNPRRVFADLTPSETDSLLRNNLSNRNGRRTRYVVAEVVEESSPSSQLTTFTTLASSDASSVLPSTITPILSSTTTSSTHHHVASPIDYNPVEETGQSSQITNDSANKSSFFLTLGACIDDIVFEHAYHRKGVSLYAIKKHLEEKYCYDSWHYRKSIRNYIVESLARGQLDQVSGRGACGSFRLSQSYRRKFMRAKLQLDSFYVEKVSKKSHSIQHTRNNNKTSSNLSMINLTSIRLKRRLISAKRKTKSIHSGNTIRQSASLSHIPNVKMVAQSQIY